MLVATCMHRAKRYLFVLAGSCRCNPSRTDCALALHALGTGWMAKVKLSDPSELDELMDAAGYEAFCAE